MNLKLHIKGTVVMVGTSVCAIDQLSDTQVTCRVSAKSTGAYNTSIHNMLGFSNSDITFTYNLVISSLSISQGSLNILMYLLFYI